MAAVATKPFAQIHLMSQLPPFLDQEAFQTVPHVLVTSQMEYSKGGLHVAAFGERLKATTDSECGGAGNNRICRNLVM